MTAVMAAKKKPTHITVPEAGPSGSKKLEYKQLGGISRT